MWMWKNKKIERPNFAGQSVRAARVPQPNTLTGWRFYGFVGLLVGTFGLSMYPVVVDPILHVDKYKENHKKIETELYQAGVLPGQLKKWEDPWERAKSK